MIVIKRDGTKEEFSIEKVISAVNKSFESVNQVTPDYVPAALMQLVEESDVIGVEKIQDKVETFLMKTGNYKAYSIQREA